MFGDLSQTLTVKGVQVSNDVVFIEPFNIFIVFVFLVSIYGRIG
ncbi:hypothetical protein FOFC_06964 [Fusarium oxysporum]|nr:hypothetical protein FOFC_06964 [Fusarium oxysporum]